MFVSFNANVLSPLNAVQQSFVYAFSKKRSIVLFVTFSFIVMSFYSLCYARSGFLTKYSGVRYSEKKQVKCRAWGAGKCPHFRNSESL